MNVYEHRMQRVLNEARKTYGNDNQILVSIEELNELACVLAKYPRYADKGAAVIELYEKVLDEVADVEIILNHVKAIFNIPPSELVARKVAKVARVERWLSKSASMQTTTEDREVHTMATSQNNK